jgi:hypothetical protein
VTSADSALPPLAGSNAWGVVATDDWAVWSEHNDIHALNLRTGAVKHVTNDTRVDSSPQISDADGTYVVWQSKVDANATVSAIKVKNLNTGGSPSTLVSEADFPQNPHIYGKRVAYFGHYNGFSNVFVKTIGSSAAPLRITGFTGNVPGVLEQCLAIGNHIVAWRGWETPTTIFTYYYDYNTGLTKKVFVPGNVIYDPNVSGDRMIVYVGGDPTWDMRVYDTRIAKTNEPFALVDVTDGDTGMQGSIDGSRIAYLLDREIHFVKLTVPSISLNSVPKRIPHKGHIHLKGSISDQGIRIGGASLGIERYASGKWTLIKTITASAAGTFSYQTPHNHSKTKYRVVYDGFMGSMFGSQAEEHLSAVSSVKTAWPK